MLPSQLQQSSTHLFLPHSPPQHGCISSPPLLGAPRFSSPHLLAHRLVCIVSRLSMSNPLRRASVADTPVSGRTSSLFQRLLQEINDNDTPRSDPVFPFIDDSTPKRSPEFNFSRRASLNCTIAPPSRQGSNAWAKGSTVAEDARQKLRALDEARQRKSSVSQSAPLETLTTTAKPNNTPSSRISIPYNPQSQALKSPLFCSDFTFNRAATFADFDRRSPITDDPDEFSCRAQTPICLPTLCCADAP